MGTIKKQHPNWVVEMVKEYQTYVHHRKRQASVQNWIHRSLPLSKVLITAHQIYTCQLHLSIRWWRCTVLPEPQLDGDGSWEGWMPDMAAPSRTPPQHWLRPFGVFNPAKAGHDQVRVETALWWKSCNHHSGLPHNSAAVRLESSIQLRQDWIRWDSGDSSVVRALDLWLKGLRFNSQQEQQENILL